MSNFFFNTSLSFFWAVFLAFLPKYSPIPLIIVAALLVFTLFCEIKAFNFAFRFFPYAVRLSCICFFIVSTLFLI